MTSEVNSSAPSLRPPMTPSFTTYQLVREEDGVEVKEGSRRLHERNKNGKNNLHAVRTGTAIMVRAYLVMCTLALVEGRSFQRISAM